jgi:hypothetical protein
VDALKGFQFMNHLIIEQHVVLLAEDAVLAEAPKIAPNDPQAIHEGFVGHPLENVYITMSKAPMPCPQVCRLVPVAPHNRGNNPIPPFI